MKSTAVQLIILLFFTVAFSASQFAVLVDSGIVNVPALVDASAMAVSRLQDDVVWVSNGHSDNNKIYAIDAHGKLITAYYLKVKWQRNWEDMASGPGPDPAKTYLYVGDIGDNDSQWPTKTVYRFEEPLAVHKGDNIIDTIRTIDKLEYVYPDTIRNAEAMFLDPLTLDYYIISKEQNGKVYRASYPQPTASIDTLELLDSIPFLNINSADISASGDEILIKDYGRIYYWKRAAGESYAAAMKRAYKKAVYRFEPCGEAICWSRNADAYFTISEERDSVDCRLYHYVRNTTAVHNVPAERIAPFQKISSVFLTVADYNAPDDVAGCFDLSGRTVKAILPGMKLLVHKVPRHKAAALP